MMKLIYSFGAGTAEGRANMRDLLGGKGANLAEMSSLGLPVPPGFTITTEVCTHFYANRRTYPPELEAEVAAALRRVEEAIGAKLGDPKNPLLVSVRSGARASMPGMMDTVLNLGLNDRAVEGLARQSGDERFAYDSYRRFIQMYGQVVLGIEHHHFEEVIENRKFDTGQTLDTDLSAEDWKIVVNDFKEVVLEEHGHAFPQDPREQLWGAVGAVFGSWMNPRAVTYRRLHEIAADCGTAVNIQAMVFGNMGEDCATGVASTRNPSTGANEFYGEYLVNAQGEDVVAGIRIPQHLTIAGKEVNKSSLPAMEEVMPEVLAELLRVRRVLENHYRDMQDIEFTVERGRLWMLQTRTGRRTVQAALKIAVSLVEEGVIDRREAISRIEPNSLDQLLHPMLDPAAEFNVLAHGLPVSPGVASGRIVFSADEAEVAGRRGESVILVRIETGPEDLHGIRAARGLVTARGGMTSHARLAAKIGRPCVAAAGDLRIDYTAGTLSVQNIHLKAGDLISLNGWTGEVIQGPVSLIEPKLTDDFARVMAWADELCGLKVRSNAETPTDARIARHFGAQGIGLSRTEHMFFKPDRITAIREMIMANEGSGRSAALAKLLPMQRADFTEIFKIMAGLPVTIRLLDPPRHEFLPKTAAEFEEMARVTGTSVVEIRQRTDELREVNPMLGHRGCRLGITYPEIYEMQAVAIFEAASLVIKETGVAVELEIMVPLIATRREFDIVKAVVDRVAREIMDKAGVTTPYVVGTMIELPLAALRAGEIAEAAAFFSFGTNELTQAGYGLSRDDAAFFMGTYERVGIFGHDPFVRLEATGVGELIKIAAERGRAARPDLKLGICGEHGGDPVSIRFCREVGLNYVSCSPYRVPIARIAAAQAEIALFSNDGST